MDEPSGDRAANIRAAADEGAIGHVDGRLNDLTKDRFVAIRPTYPEGPLPEPVSRRQHGGATAGGLTLVGEAGPELAQFPAGTRITPAEQTEAMLARQRGGDTYHQTITINTRQTDEQTIRQLRRWTRRNGEIRLS